MSRMDSIQEIDDLNQVDKSIHALGLEMEVMSICCVYSTKTTTTTSTIHNKYDVSKKYSTNGWEDNSTKLYN